MRYRYRGEISRGWSCCGMDHPETRARRDPHRLGVDTLSRGNKETKQQFVLEITASSLDHVSLDVGGLCWKLINASVHSGFESRNRAIVKSMHRSNVLIECVILGLRINLMPSTKCCNFQFYANEGAVVTVTLASEIWIFLKSGHRSMSASCDFTSLNVVEDQVSKTTHKHERRLPIRM